MLKVRIVIVHTENNEGIKKCSKKIAQKIITAYIYGLQKKKQQPKNVENQLF